MAAAIRSSPCGSVTDVADCSEIVNVTANVAAPTLTTQRLGSTYDHWVVHSLALSQALAVLVDLQACACSSCAVNDADVDASRLGSDLPVTVSIPGERECADCSAVYVQYCQSSA